MPELSTRVIETRRELYRPDRVISLAKYLYVTYISQQAVPSDCLPFDGLEEPMKAVWLTIARAAIEWITGGVNGSR